MVILHNPLVAIYASSALATALNLGLIVYQRNRLRRISRDIGFLEERTGFLEERNVGDDIQRRLCALEENRRPKAAA